MRRVVLRAPARNQLAIEWINRSGRNQKIERMTRCAFVRPLLCSVWENDTNQTATFHLKKKTDRSKPNGCKTPYRIAFHNPTRKTTKVVSSLITLLNQYVGITILVDNLCTSSGCRCPCGRSVEHWAQHRRSRGHFFIYRRERSSLHYFDDAIIEYGSCRRSNYRFCTYKWSCDPSYIGGTFWSKFSACEKRNYRIWILAGRSWHLAQWSSLCCIC